MQERKETVDHSFVPAQPGTIAEGNAGTDERKTLILKVVFAAWLSLFVGILLYEVSSYQVNGR